jgi:hypothetical protein
MQETAVLRRHTHAPRRAARLTCRVEAQVLQVRERPASAKQALQVRELGVRALGLGLRQHHLDLVAAQLRRQQGCVGACVCGVCVCVGAGV